MAKKKADIEKGDCEETGKEKTSRAVADPGFVGVGTNLLTCDDPTLTRSANAEDIEC